MALVIDRLENLTESLVKPPLWPQAKGKKAKQARLMHKCNRDSDCEIADLLVFYISLLHLKEDT